MLEEVDLYSPNTDYIAQSPKFEACRDVARKSTRGLLESKGIFVDDNWKII